VKLHHSAICTHDVEASLRFWRDGLGFEVQFDHSFEGDWPTLFGAPGAHLRSVFLGDPADHESGIVELVDFGVAPPGAAAVDEPRRGFFLLSVFADLDSVLARLRELGLGGEPRQIEVGGTRMAVVRDPNDVLVEVIDAGAQANLGRIADRP
jgi:catechol 2,3-dioxygenase-like lactoylglutathione lyase family enzyme